jgi:hypothetical protein
MQYGTCSYGTSEAVGSTNRKEGSSMSFGPNHPTEEVLKTEDPFYLVFDEIQDGVVAEESILELEEIDRIGQMALEMPQDETPVFLTCT